MHLYYSAANRMCSQVRTYCIGRSGQRNFGDHLKQVTLSTVVNMWDLSLHHHCVFVIQGAAQWERSGKRDTGLHFIDILVLPFHPSGALCAGVPIRAVRIHSGGCWVAKNYSQMRFVLCRSSFSWLIKRGFHLSLSSRRCGKLQGGGNEGACNVAEPSRQLFLCVYHTHSHTQM